MSCDQDRRALEMYLDGEAAPEQERATEQHLRTCSSCAAEIAAMMRLRRQTKAAGSRFTPSSEFRRSIQSRIAPQRKSWGGMRLVALAAVAVALIVVAVVWTRQAAGRAEAFREVADLHVSDLASANPYDVVSSDRHTVKPWFQGRIPFSFNLPEFAGTEFTLLGGRLVYLRQQPAAQVIVGFGQHKITVLITQETSALGTVLPFRHGVSVRNSFNMATWKSHGLRFFVVGDAESAEIQRLTEAFQNANP